MNKVKNNSMKLFKIIISFLIIIVSLHVHEPALCKDNPKKKYIKLMVVTAKSGLRMRKGPGKNHKKILVIPLNGLITITSIDKGTWFKTEWKGKPGWVFGGFLKEAPPWIENVHDFWINKDSHGDESATAFSNIASGGDGASMGCPGGIGPFKVEESVLAGKLIKISIVSEANYPFI
ncbi:MAG: SH3 domain-containing protein [bacterium]|nr:SH3 domain-containing protein [bacterium]